VLVLLPPSEGKTAPEEGPALDLSQLVFRELDAKRERLLDALERLAGRPRSTALRALGISAAQAAEIERDARLRQAPAAPAHRVYTGVLYEHLRLSDLDGAGRSRVLIASALWGMVRADDPIPAYRLPDQGLVVDLRSGTYATAWTPRSATVATVRGFVERDGRRTVVSHSVKATRGDVARILLSLPTPPSTPDEVADAVARAGHRVELTRARGGWSVDVIG
jgi:uncharacterized protein